MISAKEWLRKIVKDHDLFLSLYLVAEEKVLRIRPKGDEFGTGFLIGFWLGRLYGKEECNQSVHITESGNRGRNNRR